MSKKKCKITLLIWKDEEWSADEKSLQVINELINNNKMKHPIGETIFLAIGWIALSPFILRDFLVLGFKWLVKKIKRK
jgi:hypothetical protein